MKDIMYKLQRIKDEEISQNLDNILFNLDFDKIHQVMELFKWGWISVEGDTPTKPELMYEVKKQLLHLYKNLDIKVDQYYTKNYKDEYLLTEFVERSFKIGGFEYKSTYWFVPSVLQEGKQLYTEVNFILTGWHNSD